jgi:hypothetical protein
MFVHDMSVEILSTAFNEMSVDEMSLDEMSWRQGGSTLTGSITI